MSASASIPETSGPSLVMASLLAAYPESDFAANIRSLLDDQLHSSYGGPSVRTSYGNLQMMLFDVIGSTEQLDDLRSEYIDLFDRGRQVNSLYETEYGRERALVKGNELVDIAGFYRAFGFELAGDRERAEMLDHVSVELEFYSLLVLKNALLEDLGDGEGSEIVLDARRKFLKSHLGRFIGAICQRPGVQESPFYSRVFAYCRDLIEEECRVLGVEVQPESWIAGQSEAPEITCGGSIGCVPGNQGNQKGSGPCSD